MNSTCPDGARLESFVLGRLREEEVDAIAEHLEHCSTCIAKLSPLQGQLEDPLLKALRAQTAGTPLPASPQLAALVERLKHLDTPKVEPAVDPETLDPRDTREQVQASTAEVRPTLPDCLGRYRILQRLGEGGMGTVYKAHDPELNRMVAVKVPRFTGSAEAQQPARLRFLREARAAAAIRHPHVCPIYDVGEHAGRPYVVMAYVEGQSLAQRLQQRHRFDDCREAVRLASQVADGLEAVHLHGIVHRDLKPGNVLLDKSGQAILTDFGLARSAQDDDHLTAEGAVVGTPAYMAPEQIAPGIGVVGPRSDIYSLGVVLYQLVTGRLPFTGSTIALLFQVAKEPARRPSQLRPDLDPNLEQIIERAMARSPEDRFRSAAEVGKALADWLADPSNSSARLPPKSLRSRLRSQRAWGAGLTAIAVALGGTSLYMMIANNPGTPSAQPPTGTLPSEQGTWTGWIDVRVWEPGNPQRHNVRLHQPGALPLRAGDQVRIEAELNRPAYVYVVWIDTDGKVWPVFPWKPGNWAERPPAEKPITRLALPEQHDLGWPIEGGPGMETLVLLARAAPLPAALDLEKLLAGLPAQKAQDFKAAVWFENGAVVRKEADRAPNFFNAQRIDDPVLETQRLLKDRLGGHFQLARAVSFGNQGK